MRCFSLGKHLAKHAQACTDRISRPTANSTETGPTSRDLQKTRKKQRERTQRAPGDARQLPKWCPSPLQRISKNRKVEMAQTRRKPRLRGKNVNKHTGKRQVSKLAFCRIWKSTREPEFGRRASRDGLWEHFGRFVCDCSSIFDRFASLWKLILKHFSGAG